LTEHDHSYSTLDFPLADNFISSDFELVDMMELTGSNYGGMLEMLWDHKVWWYVGLYFSYEDLKNLYYRAFNTLQKGTYVITRTTIGVFVRRIRKERHY